MGTQYEQYFQKIVYGSGTLKPCKVCFICGEIKVKQIMRLLNNEVLRVNYVGLVSRTFNIYMPFDCGYRLCSKCISFMEKVCSFRRNIIQRLNSHLFQKDYENRATFTGPNPPDDWIDLVGANQNISLNSEETNESPLFEETRMRDDVLMLNEVVCTDTTDDSDVEFIPKKIIKKTEIRNNSSSGNQLRPESMAVGVLRHRLRHINVDHQDYCRREDPVAIDCREYCRPDLAVAVDCQKYWPRDVAITVDHQDYCRREDISALDVASLASLVNRLKKKLLEQGEEFDQFMHNVGEAQKTECSDVISKHSWKLSANLLRFYKTGFLCDTVVRTKDTTIKMHSVVLASLSLQARALLTEQFNSGRSTFEIECTDSSSKLTEIIVHYMYTGELDLPNSYTTYRPHSRELDYLWVKLGLPAERLKQWRIEHSRDKETSQKPDRTIANHAEIKTAQTSNPPESSTLRSSLNTSKLTHSTTEKSKQTESTRAEISQAEIELSAVDKETSSVNTDLSTRNIAPSTVEIITNNAEIKIAKILKMPGSSILRSLLNTSKLNTMNRFQSTREKPKPSESTHAKISPAEIELSAVDKETSSVNITDPSSKTIAPSTVEIDKPYTQQTSVERVPSPMDTEPSPVTFKLEEDNSNFGVEDMAKNKNVCVPENNRFPKKVDR